MTQNLSIIEKVEEYARDAMDGTELAHDFSHIDRVRKLGIEIAKGENFKDVESVEIAVLLHDIGLSKVEERNQHGIVGAQMAKEYLNKNSSFIPQKIDEISKAIQAHNNISVSEGILTNILRDADMLDLFGAVGLMRAYISKHYKQEYNSGNIKGETWEMSAMDFDKRFEDGIGIGQTIVDQINFQISCFDNLRTPTAIRMAKPLVEFMRNFILQLENEVNIATLTLVV